MKLQKNSKSLEFNVMNNRLFKCSCRKLEKVGVRGRRIPEFEASLVYRSSRTVRAKQRNPVGIGGGDEVGGGEGREKRKGERKQQARKEKN